MASDEFPVATVYVQNLEERAKIEPLRDALNTIFGEYGNVIDIVAKTNLRAKGQAFVVFDTPESARAAFEEVQGFELFDKPMKLALAKSRSDATVRQLGNDDDLEQHKRRRLAEKDMKKAAMAAEEQKRLKRAGQGGAADLGAGKPSKIARTAGLKSTTANSMPGTAVVPDEYLPPNRTLFVQNLPEDYDVDALTIIFGRFEGFREVRLVPGRRGIAFVEYETEHGAITAKENTAGMSFGESHVIKVTYQRH